MRADAVDGAAAGVTAAAGAVRLALVGAAGRGVVAARPLPAGTVVLVERPAAAVAVPPADGGDGAAGGRVCDHCFGRLPAGGAAPAPCTAAAACTAAYCGWACAADAAAAGAHPAAECGGGLWAAAPPDVRLAVRAARAIAGAAAATAAAAAAAAAAGADAPPPPADAWAAAASAGALEALDAHEVDYAATAAGVRLLLGHTLDAVVVAAGGLLPPLGAPADAPLALPPAGGGGGGGGSGGCPPAGAPLPPTVRFARLLLAARTNAVGIRGGGGGGGGGGGRRVATGLYPRAALFNHHPRAAVAWRFGRGGVLVATTTRAVDRKSVV